MGNTSHGVPQVFPVKASVPTTVVQICSWVSMAGRSLALANKLFRALPHRALQASYCNACGIYSIVACTVR